MIGLTTTSAALIRTSRIARIYVPNMVMDECAEIISGHIKENCPVKTGDLVKSVQIESGSDYRRVFTDSPHAIYVEEGTQPSPGRYVPAIGKRLTKGERTIKGKKQRYNTGIHPGIPATHFFRYGVDDSDAEVQLALEHGADIIIAKMRG